MKKTSLAVVAALVALAVGSTALATMELQKEFNAKYTTAKANCASCHKAKMPKKDAWELNAYGKDMVEKAIVDPKAAKKAYDYEKIKDVDSDGDGVKNGAEVAKGTNPGDPASK